MDSGRLRIGARAADQYRRRWPPACQPGMASSFSSMWYGSFVASAASDIGTVPGWRGSKARAGWFTAARTVIPEGTELRVDGDVDARAEVDAHCGRRARSR